MADQGNKRSSHTYTVKRGGGGAVRQLVLGQTSNPSLLGTFAQSRQFSFNVRRWSVPSFVHPGSRRRQVSIWSRTGRCVRCTSPTWWRRGRCSSASVRRLSSSAPSGRTARKEPEKEKTAACLSFFFSFPLVRNSACVACPVIAYQLAALCNKGSYPPPATKPLWSIKNTRSKGCLRRC